MENMWEKWIDNRCENVFVRSIQVVFGEVVEGMETVKKIEALGSQSGKTQKKISIAESGQITEEKKAE